jgi:hypothetical protein
MNRSSPPCASTNVAQVGCRILALLVLMLAVLALITYWPALSLAWGIDGISKASIMSAE